MNFSLSKTWKYSVYLRYNLKDIVILKGLVFFEKNKTLICQHFFDFDIDDDQLSLLKEQVLLGKTIRFNYINDGVLYKQLKEWCKNNNFVLNILDEWNAPKLETDCQISKYMEFNHHAQMKRNFKNYLKNKNNFLFKSSSNCELLELWSLVLEIDHNSWKYDERSDMKSLNREDLQYLPFLIKHPNNSNLIVLSDLDNKPLAYSLMFKGENDYWYAVKWGASYDGRKESAGFCCLFYHLEYLKEMDSKIKIDFWGRRSNAYDKLKNHEIKRMHLSVSKGEE